MFHVGSLAINITQGELRTVGAPRRNEALAFIIDHIVRTGVSPSAEDVGRAMGVSRQRAQQFIEQLIEEDVLERTPGSRALRIRDLSHCRHIIVATLHALGMTVAEPMGDMQPPLSLSQLPLLPPFEHIPDPE